MTDSGNLWELNKSIEVDSQKLRFNIDTFRSIGGFNAKLASWDPKEHSSRYYKSLLYELSKDVDKKIRKSKYFDGDKNLKGRGLNFFLNKIQNRNLGSPTCIQFIDNLVDIDYVLSCDELNFIFPEIQKSKVILEIGAGFGRLPHSILQNFDEVEKYYIVDLDWMLELSSEFLKHVLSEEDFYKIQFVESSNYRNLLFDALNANNHEIDLSINIDSFQEMPTKVALDYLDFIGNNSEKFYSKNAICKYHPSVVDLQLKDDSQYKSALEMGICKESIDIYNSEELKTQQSKYLQQYCPKDFKLKKDEQCFGQFLYYQSALFEKI